MAANGKGVSIEYTNNLISKVKDYQTAETLFEVAYQEGKTTFQIGNVKWEVNNNGYLKVSTYDNSNNCKESF